ncbi:3-oxoacyl-[acyl-carrier-protein] synthase-1 [Sphingobacterium allocomposti]|uniref:3-oxoacyl-[acyl-carrier-protein] synthase-1 n=1 Tax=Sphingobacterium allocomposti TaxID=415956 RepID=A0A5S5DMA3_9SPHI|nr:beta-ketoacyl-[acyl-carrier-protein] synthase family protein [Sphingobacterium composti Yoo et al. 2007 non Ten et al. 2007]TYP95942.1 3-oxoacyl-[acyl-carrier-protein] synthase-1 [Sphingobacterium composti Yoo et al. 2007 non Ten et al. 2007]
MNPRVAITGVGIISSIGNSVEANLSALLNKRPGISRVQNFATTQKDSIWVGEVKLTNAELVDMLGLPHSNNFTRTALLGCYAAKQAVQSAGITLPNDYRTGIISSTSVGGMDYTERYFYRYLDDLSVQPYITSHDAGDSSHKIADYLGIKGFVSTISTACSSAANAIMMGARLVQAGRVDRIIVGGTDALSKFTINGFKTLMILSDEFCKPFDNNRKGLNLGEAAAYLVLESEQVVKKEKKQVLAYLSGYGNANDAFHQTASSDNGEGAYLAMRKALEVAGLSPDEIGYINVHGTATPNNDLSEGRALQRAFGDSVPLFSSTKAFTGHTLAAAAAIEAVYSILSIRNEVVFPNLNFDTPMSEINLVPQTELVYRPIKHVLSNSFGFGGNCSTLIFSQA